MVRTAENTGNRPNDAPASSADSAAPAAAPDIDRVAFISLGCPKNLVDSEKMLGTLGEAGYTLVSEDQAPDTVVVNTCGFLEASKVESLDVIGEQLRRKERGEVKRVVVAGCLVQRHRAKMLEWAPGIDAMIGVFDRDHIIDAVGGGAPTPEERTDISADPDRPRYWIAGNALQAANARGIDTVGLTVNGKDGKGLGYFESDANRFRLTPRHWAYLRVSEGCNQRCAFCTIPSIRGKMRSKPLEAITAEARALMADGAFELNLIGQDTTSYGYDIGYDEPSTQGLVGMLRAIDGVAKDFGGGWMRLMYAYPTNFTDEMIDAMAALPNIVKYIDIPLQHMSTNMLQRMRRGLGFDEQAALMEKLRERIPGLAIRTTFITGFPGETDADHQILLEYIREFQFDAMGVFKYSREAGTPAGTMDLDTSLHVPDELKEAREGELMLAQRELAFENAAYLAEQAVEFDVLIDEPAAGETTGMATPGVSDGARLYAGRCYHQSPQIDSMTYVASATQLSPGELVRCTIVSSDGYDLIARPSEELVRRISLPVVG